MPRWRDHHEHPLTAESLQALFNNEIACIRVKSFATPAESKAFVDAMDTVGLAHEYKAIGPNVRAKPRYLGVPQFEYRKKTKSDYFATVERAYVLEGGRIVASGPASEIARDGALEKAYLAVN